MPIDKACCIPNCGNRSPYYHFHCFPTNGERRKIWLDNIGHEELNQLSPSQLVYKYICHSHFEDKYVGKECKRLKRTAVPTIFPLVPNARIEESTTQQASSPPRPSQEGSVWCEPCVGPTVKRKRFISTGKRRSNRRSSMKGGRKERLNAFLKDSLEGLNESQQLFVRMQLLNKNVKKKGHRFSMDEKLLCLAIYKNSPKGYKLLQKLFTMPSRGTLRSILKLVKFGPGLNNNNVVTFLKQETSSWSDRRKYCSIIFDEVALSCGVDYSLSEKKIVGIVDFEQGEREKKFADHALVFMVRGVCESWKQVFAYYFCEGTTPSHRLAIILKEIVKAVKECNLYPLALVCDQGATNRGAINYLKKTAANVLRESEEYVVRVSGVDLFVMYDPPHLLKGLRNNMMKYDILFDRDRKCAKWSDIIDVYERDGAIGGSRMMRKLTDEHVYPNKVRKMKVSHCAQVFSDTVRCMLLLQAPHGNINTSFSFLPSTYAPHFIVTTSYFTSTAGRPDINDKTVGVTTSDTASIVGFLDKLFDSVNGTKIYCQGKLRTRVTIKTNHEQFWLDSIKQLEDMKFVDSNSRTKTCPSLKNWIITLKSFVHLWRFLKSKNIIFFSPRNLNQDPLENLFGKIRSHNFRNTNPSCMSFQNSMKALLVCDLTVHSRVSNCEIDFSKNVMDLKKIMTLFGAQSKPVQSHTNLLFTNFISGNLPTAASFAGSSLLSISRPPLTPADVIRHRNTVYADGYVSGWIARKLLIKTGNCISCKNKILINHFTEQHRYIDLKDKNKSLMRPNDLFMRRFSECSQLIKNYLDNYFQKANLFECLIDYLRVNLDFTFLECTDSNHFDILKFYFVHLIIKFKINHWCKVINSLLTGVDNIRNIYDRLTEIEKNAYNKYKKSLKRKIIHGTV